MEIRNSFKDYLGRWSDDVTTKEKIIWSVLIMGLSIIFFNIFIFPTLF
jgi:hypothetical protein|tara:strand:+ start:24 stop:167 length:144 start_codon:yes stop_codon:yes gene_type:complete